MDAILIFMKTKLNSLRIRWVAIIVQRRPNLTNDQWRDECGICVLMAAVDISDYSP